MAPACSGSIRIGREDHELDLLLPTGRESGRNRGGGGEGFRSTRREIEWGARVAFDPRVSLSNLPGAYASMASSFSAYSLFPVLLLLLLVLPVTRGCSSAVLILTFVFNVVGGFCAGPSRLWRAQGAVYARGVRVARLTLSPASLLRDSVRRAGREGGGADAHVRGSRTGLIRGDRVSVR